MNDRPHRDTILLEDATVISHEAYPGDQFVMRVQSPGCATRALPGQFAHLSVDPQRPMRRPISIMRTSPNEGWVDFLYKAVGDGTRLLAHRKPDETVSLLGPIGVPFNVGSGRPLLIGGGVGMPPMVFLADSLRGTGHHPFVILGSEVPFPFDPRPSQILVPGVPEGVIASMPLLDDWGIPSRLASLQGYPGCHPGYVTDLARLWLDALDDVQRAEVTLYACGPHPMLEAVVNLARNYGLPVQVSLEEFMACAVGGCAGCVVEVTTPAGPAMKRVCVDGPVFDGYAVF
ncbi:MAG: dihydroorotate dehydrogenase electron transfer subunit [Chromatiaceae bacterium]|nr:dihydroorotate dehydrogenase electron transfer subunit [Gammaproteobacteria bacterium]MCP5300071.1 dihydroorotate dehydrogenase electron transfer subunit [Chromatiaceae bacterium]MCP5422143.1 dihydroorotate dehydrogenase electron transfer subunit [Chromatiaceae bacterium]